MSSRLFVPAERMADRFDKAYTLNFTTIACVRGALSAERLQRALRCLERRHPLLRARIQRDGGHPAFVLDQAREIPLLVVTAPAAELLTLASATIEPCSWDDAGPHAELTWVRHDGESSSLMLRQHHVVSDGGSGIIAMRDLLAFIENPALDQVEPLPSPGQDAFFPQSHAALRQAFLEELQRDGVPPARKDVLRVSRWSEPSPSARRSVSQRIRLELAESQALAQRARREGATVHGVLMATLALAVAQETGKSALQRLTHPVDLRRYLREIEPTCEPILDVMGYYVSGVTTEHEVQSSDRLSDLARAITEAVRAAKLAREPLLSAPVRGPLLVERTCALDADAFRQLAEQKMFLNTFGISNLGPLERLGVTARVGQLEVQDFFFVAASSIMNQLGGTAVSFAGRLSLQLTCVEPLIERDFLARLAKRAQTILHEYAQSAQA